MISRTPVALKPLRQFRLEACTVGQGPAAELKHSHPGSQLSTCAASSKISLPAACVFCAAPGLSFASYRTCVPFCAVPRLKPASDRGLMVEALFQELVGDADGHHSAPSRRLVPDVSCTALKLQSGMCVVCAFVQFLSSSLPTIEVQSSKELFQELDRDADGHHSTETANQTCVPSVLCATLDLNPACVHSVFLSVCLCSSWAPICLQWRCKG